MQQVFKQEQYTTRQILKTHVVFRIRYLKCNKILKRNKSKSALMAKERVYKFINTEGTISALIFQSQLLISIFRLQALATEPTAGSTTAPVMCLNA
jgi:hypothetical protein